MRMRRSFCCAVILALLMIFVSAPVLHANKEPPLQPVNLNTAILHWSCSKFLASGRRRSAWKEMRKYVTVGNPVAARKPANGGNNKIFDSSICLQINIRAATENRESESADTELDTAQSQEKEPTSRSAATKSKPDCETFFE